MKTQENQLLKSDSRPKVWVAGRDFNLKNLKVKKGQMLPGKWCASAARTFLKNEYGKDCILLTDQFIDEDSEQSANTIQELTDRITKLEEVITELSPKKDKKEKVEKLESKKEDKQIETKNTRPRLGTKKL